MNQIFESLYLVCQTTYIDLPIEIMEIHGRVTLAMDIMNVDRMYFLINFVKEHSSYYC
jgi:hypothetical protein